ncbi:hypothetical protein SAMN05421676_10555 [Salinibacillus kushneri]|uniref:Uncharacterized protein n=1 Tax=Salinibacillus kushneri TaxID=237682 RepID=A0A1I0ETF9_9BACI|nr:hypothetical protein [Salinibacillus kushneri]SET48129.1 hypothetical protein SAMN05421676_10555 [Salinibacillus kushneri]
MKKKELWNELRTFPKDRKIRDRTKMEILQRIKTESVRQKRSRLGPMFKKVFISFVSIAVLFFTAIFLWSEVQMNQKTTPQTEDSAGQETILEEGEDEKTPEALNEEDVLRIMQQYEKTFKELYNRANEDQKLPNVQSLDEVYEQLRTVMSADLAESFTELYFREENGEVYVIAQDGATWLEEDLPFDLEKNKRYGI